jgi:hypothetical protein
MLLHRKNERRDASCTSLRRNVAPEAVFAGGSTTRNRNAGLMRMRSSARWTPVSKSLSRRPSRKNPSSG